LIGIDNRELGAMFYYRPFPRTGFEFGGGYQSRVPYLISSFGGSGSNPHLLRGQGYELRGGVNFFPKTGLAYRSKRMPRWGFSLVWREFHTDKFCRAHASNGKDQIQRDIVKDHVDQLKLMVNKGYTWSWGLGGSKLGIFLDTRFGFGLGFNGIRREKFSWGYGGVCGGNAFKEEDPVDRFGYPFPAVKLDLRLGISTLY
jgi:hypothetical protein